MKRGHSGEAARRADLVGAGILLFIALQILGALLLAFWRGAQGPAGGTAYDLLRLLFTAATLGLPVLFMQKGGKQLAPPLPFGRPAIPTAAVLPLFLLFMLVLNLLTEWLKKTIGAPQTSRMAGTGEILPLTPMAWVLLFVSSCLLPALLEELLFRGAVQGLLAPFGKGVSVWVTALLFALMHPAGWDTPTVFCLGAALCAVRLACGSLWPCIALHFANNFVAFASVMLATLAPPALTGWFTLGFAALSLAGSGFALWYMGRKRLWGRFKLQGARATWIGYAKLSHSRLFGAALLVSLLFCVGRGLWA